MTKENKKNIEKILSQNERLKQLLNLDINFDNESQPSTDPILRSRLEKFSQTMENSEELEQTLALLKRADEQQEEQSARIITTISQKQLSTRRRIVLKIVSVSAAVAIIVLSMLVFNNVDNSGETIVATKIAQNFSEPTLILSSNKKIPLSEDANLSTTEQLAIQSSDANTNVDVSKEMNTVVVPNGFTTTITLPDGSRIQMNSNSELQYSNNFNKGDRKVWLKGEACFNVVKSDIPFIVEISKEYQVKVFGTEFVVNSTYGDNIETTLLSGSVAVLHNETQTMIKPNHQFIYYTKNKTHNVKEVDVTNAKSWLDGKFVSENEALSILLTDISNWYNISFDYKDSNLKDMIINAVIYKSLSVEKIISIIENSVNIRIINEKTGKYMIENKR